MQPRARLLLLAVGLCALAAFVVFASFGFGGGANPGATYAATRSNTGALGLLFGAFCALWAQNTKRNPWVWFFAGLFFNVVTITVLLYKNGQDPKTLAGNRT